MISQVAERIITMKKIKEVVMRFFSTLVMWLGISRANMPPDELGKLLKSFCEGVNKARDLVVQMEKNKRKVSTAGPTEFAPPSGFATQQKSRGTIPQCGPKLQTGAFPSVVLSELSDKVSNVRLVKPDLKAKDSSSTSSMDDNKGLDVDQRTERRMWTKEKKDELAQREKETDIQMEASVEELDVLLADFTIKSRERRRRRLRS